MVKIKIPKNWDEVLVDQFISLKTLNNEDNNIFDGSLEILSILTDTLPDDDVWEDMDSMEFIEKTKEILWLSSEPSHLYKDKIGEFTLIDINKISLGEFIDLDYYFSEGYFVNLTKIAGILYRKTRKTEWGELEFEPHGTYDYEKRGESFLELPITNIYGLIYLFLDFKSIINQNYEPLFEPELVQTDENYEETEFDAEEQKEIEREETYKKWAWENIIHTLSSGDITKYDEITKLPVVFIFNNLGFRKEMEL